MRPPFTLPLGFSINGPPSPDGCWTIVHNRTGEHAYVGGHYRLVSAADWQELADFEVMLLRRASERYNFIKD